MQDFVLPAQIHAALVEYLATRPIREAAPLYNALHELKPAPETLKYPAANGPTTTAD